MAVETGDMDDQKQRFVPPMLGGFAAIAESLWMGAAQASDVLEPLNIGRRLGAVLPRLPRLHLRGLFTREFTIAEASFLLMASFFLSAVLGAVRQILFNVQFGAGSDASAYYAAFRLPDTLFSLIAGGALSSAMIPVLLSTSQQDGEAAGWRLTNLVLNLLLAGISLTVLVGELFAPAFVSHVLAPGFDAHTSNLTVTLTRLMLIQPVILAVGSVATAVLNSRNQFLLTALSVASHNIGLIAGIMATRVHPALGIYGPTLGVVAGAVLQVLILLPGLLGRHYHYQPILNFADRHLREVIRLLIPNGMAVGVLYAGFILDTSFASRASQAAALAALQNAFLLVGLPIALLGQAVGQSAFPRLAAYASEGQWQQMQRTLLRTFWSVLALAIPALLFLIVLGRVVIRVLFEHGKFGGPAAALTYDVLVSYAIALPAYVATEVLTRGLIALRDTRTPLFTNTAQVVGRALLMTLLIGSLGVLAIPRAFAVMASLETVVLGLVLLVKLRSKRRSSPGGLQPPLQAIPSG
jgi:putative peptidoglycan lipid II flippase